MSCSRAATGTSRATNTRSSAPPPIPKPADTLVVYRPLYGDQALWVRPLAMFTETVERDGKVQPRFARIGD